MAGEKMDRINVTRSSMPPFEEYIQEIQSLFESHKLTNMGEKHQRLEQELKKFLQVPFVSLTVNGHMALENVIRALKLQGEIITTPFTFVSTTHAIVRCGCTPVFCDINESDYTIDVSKIEALITDKTVAIMPVHVYGNICDVEAIETIARKYHLYVIYDAAHAFAETYKGRSAAEFGDASVFSFHATKVFHTIEGGCVAFGNEQWEMPLKDIKNFGFHGTESVTYIGGNAKMNEFQAAMGLCNLRHIRAEISRRRHVYEAYAARLVDVARIEMWKPQKNVEHNYAYLPVVFESQHKRDVVMERLEENNIYARKYFYPITTEFECYKGRFEQYMLEHAKDISSRVLTLPMYADLQEEDIDRICTVVLKETR